MINRDSEVTFDENATIEDKLLIHTQTIADQPLKEIKQQPDTDSKSSRLSSLDGYRGLTMLGMIFADYLEGLEGSPWWLVHQPWNGFTLADLVFPAFLFIMGVAIPLAVSQKRPIRPKNIIRIFLLFGIGLFLNIIDQQFDFAHLRILGILQRMSICYGIILFIHWITDYGKHNIKRLIGGLFMVALVFIYLSLMIPWENTSIGCFRSNNLDPYCNFAGYVDRAVFTQDHIMEKTDPQGIISTFTASFTTYVGYCFGLMLLTLRGNKEKIIKYWLLFAFFCILPIYPCSLLMPFNKRLYSITFLFGVLSTSSLILTLFVVIMDFIPQTNPQSKKIIEKITAPLTWLGLNPLAIFIIMQLISMILADWIVYDDGTTPYEVFYDAVFSWMTPSIGTVVYAAFYAICYSLIAGVLFRYKLFLRL